MRTTLFRDWYDMVTENAKKDYPNLSEHEIAEILEYAFLKNEDGLVDTNLTQDNFFDGLRLVDSGEIDLEFHIEYYKDNLEMSTYEDTEDAQGNFTFLEGEYDNELGKAYYEMFLEDEINNEWVTRYLDYALIWSEVMHDCYTMYHVSEGVYIEL